MPSSGKPLGAALCLALTAALPPDTLTIPNPEEGDEGGRMAAGEEVGLGGKCVCVCVCVCRLHALFAFQATATTTHAHTHTHTHTAGHRSRKRCS